MNMLNYKDYQGSVEFDGSVLVVKILHINDSISTECDSASAVKAVFEDLVDDYLATCEEIGREPDRPYRGSFNVRVGAEIHKKAAMAAAARGMTLNSWMVDTITARISKAPDLSSDKIMEVSELFVRRNDRAKFNYGPGSTGGFSAELDLSQEETVERYYSILSLRDKESRRYGH